MPGQGVDLRRELTVFLPTVGAGSFQACRDALEKQDCQFTLDVIWNIAPMSTAFQEMLNRCTTPYYVQCDEDMILKPNAVRTLHAAIKSRDGTQIAMICYPLFDVHLDRTLLGVKAYRHDVFRDFPYNDTQSCEMDQIGRLRAAGYGFDVIWGEWASHLGVLAEDDPNILGTHGTAYGPREAFERYRDLTEKARFVGGSDWVFPWLSRFLTRFAEGGKLDDPNLWAALGCVAGYMATPEGARGEKDYREYATMTDYGEVAAAVVAPPERVDVYVTSRCNAACPFCARQRRPMVQARDFDAALANRVLDRWPSIKGACLAGFGEPLLAAHFPSLADAFISRGIYTSLITNGFAILDQLDVVPWNKFGYVNVSLNAVTPEDHATQTGTVGAYARAVQGFDALIERGVNVGLSFVVGASTLDRIPDYLSFAQRHGAHFVSLVNVLPHHEQGDKEAAQDFRNELLTTRSQSAAEKLLGFRRTAAQLGVEVWAWPELINPDHNPRKCRSPFEAIGIDGDGNLSGCCRIVGPTAAHGNFAAGGDIWGELPYLRDLRRELSGADELRFPCTRCFGNWKGA